MGRIAFLLKLNALQLDQCRLFLRSHRRFNSRLHRKRGWRRRYRTAARRQARGFCRLKGENLYFALVENPHHRRLVINVLHLNAAQCLPFRKRRQFRRLRFARLDGDKRQPRAENRRDARKRGFSERGRLVLNINLRRYWRMQLK